MHIGIIAYDFPPLNSGGSQRPYYLTRYLVTQGMNVTVFTLNESNYATKLLNYEVDPDFKKKCRIVRTDLAAIGFLGRYSELYYFNIIDQIGKRWKPQLLAAISQLHETEPFDLLFFTCPPFSLAPLGAFICEKLKIPFFLDLRDAWSQWVVSPYASYIHYLLLLRLEKKVLQSATYITYTSEQQKKDWLSLHSELNVDKFVYTPNGFNEYTVTDTVEQSDIVIYYSGSFYFNPHSDYLIQSPWYKKRPYQFFQYVPRIEEWKYRTPYFFFRILRFLFDKNAELEQRIKIKFAGQKPSWFDAMVAEFNLQPNVIHLGFITKEQNAVEMSQATYCLLTSSKVKDGQDYSVAGKTYEYFSMKKPIIGVVADGEQKKILLASGASLVLDPDEISESAGNLESLLLNKTVLNPNWKFIDQFKIPSNYRNLLEVIKTKI